MYILNQLGIWGMKKHETLSYSKCRLIRQFVLWVKIKYIYIYVVYTLVLTVLKGLRLEKVSICKIFRKKNFKWFNPKS